MIYRYSSRKEKLSESFLNSKLTNALSYDRIAGYFNSSIIEVSSEAIDSVKGNIRVVCNSDLDPLDVKSLSAAHQAMRLEWCDAKPEEIYCKIPDRLAKLYQLLTSEKLQVKVLPSANFGLIHGKAGVITLESGNKTAFLGSMNETKAGWKFNYELAWEDDSQDAIDFVQQEFDFLWNHPNAKPISQFIIEDIKRISIRKVIYEIEEWNNAPDPASPIIETPVYRKGYGLWEHQKYFINLVHQTLRKGIGARYVLADVVGLGKTVQLALSAQLMALSSDKPILVIAPKTLLWQWQGELNGLLDMPSAVWDGKSWIDENGIEHPSYDKSSIRKCPRRIGIISQGLITANSEAVQFLELMEYECIIVDECHRARRKNLSKDHISHHPDPNNLLSFLLKIAKRTKSLLLATATPVQINPIEAWDLLNILAQNNNYVLGNNFSKWRCNVKEALDYTMGKETCENVSEYWDWVRNPLPPVDEDPLTFGVFRRAVNIPDNEFVLTGGEYDNFNPQQKLFFRRIIDDDFLQNHNPFIRHIIRRTRSFLEDNINPETNEPYLKKINVNLFGEDDTEAILLTPYLRDAYDAAEEFSRLLNERIKAGGFIKTLLLRRVGSSMIAGLSTARKMLSDSMDFSEEDIDDDHATPELSKSLKDFTPQEIEQLQKFIKLLDSHLSEDPKYAYLKEYLIDKKWINSGCIVFSQYFDTVFWAASIFTKEFPGESIGLYAGGSKSGVFLNGIFQKKSKEELKLLVKSRDIRLLFGTDAASEGLNLQTLGTLINLDLPWNPTRLEQRKGRIQRIGQVNDNIYILNMRYKDSVEDRVHKILSDRLLDIHNLFGQIPDVLEDVWVEVALNQKEKAEQIINAIPANHPFAIRYEKAIGNINWESCSRVLDSTERKRVLSKGW